MRNKPFQVLLFLYCCTLKPSCNHWQHSTYNHNHGENHWKSESSLKFLVVGDWDRNGEFHQKNAADAITIYGINMLFS
ncbi:MAG: hypothetical protein MUE72_08795 [Chitinophagaceae bacterium]|jgi:hypothetical protein|nr:hypothetical protein [Chitinophagaceae bacterium]